MQLINLKRPVIKFLNWMLCKIRMQWIPGTFFFFLLLIKTNKIRIYRYIFVMFPLGGGGIHSTIPILCFMSVCYITYRRVLPTFFLFVIYFFFKEQILSHTATNITNGLHWLCDLKIQSYFLPIFCFEKKIITLLKLFFKDK